ncbi:thioredoxin-like protein AAED1, chloroplastic isoform X3 [Chenopodium quinoa]|nr:thioredoxin-like protein AAED1, chloroplastic isoform X3 [Chenopodium quinoa]
MNMALSTTTPYFSIQANKITNYTSPIFLQKQGQISIINGFSPLYKPLTQSKPSSRRTLLTIPAFSSSQGVGALVGSESNLSLLDKALVFDLNGNGIPISDLWKDRKAVVAFARHFGCVFCRKRADYLASKKEQMDAAGVALILIGPGNIDQAKAFYEQTKFGGEVYADPDHSSYGALNFVSGASTTFTPKAGLKIIQLYMEGYRQDWGLSFQKDTVSRGG